MYPELISHIKKFISLSRDEELLLNDHFVSISIKKKQFLLEPGKTCKGNYFVVKGCVRLYFINNKLTEQITQFGLENWWIADYDSLLNKQPSYFFLQAVENCELLLLTDEAQNSLFKKVPALETYFRIMYQKAFIAAQRRVQMIFSMTDEERYRNFSELYPWFMQRVPQYMLASYLGFTPQFLSRLRAKKL
jgi:CRP/FNR family transcriptional regulator